MAPSSRPHPYRATSTVNTPEGPRTSAWLAGHGGLPGDWDPPPPRPVLILVDYSPLQELTHRSQPDHALFSALASSNFRNVSAGELEALFSPGHANLNQLKQAFFHYEIYAQHWQRDYAPNGTFTWYLRTWNFATLIFKAMFSKYHSIGPLCNFWMNTDLNGASGSTITSNLLGWYLVLHSPSYCDFVAIKSAKVSSCRDFMQNPDRGEKRQYHLTMGLTWFHLLMSCLLYKTEFIRFILDSRLYQRLYMALYCFSINTVWRLFVPSAFGFYQLYSRDRFTHGAQAWRNRGGLGMAFDFEPWDFFYRSWYKARPPDCWVECLWRFPSYDLDHLGIFGAKYCTQWPRHYLTNGHIFSSNATWCTFPGTREFHLQCFPSRSLLITGGPSDPLQDLYSFQQHQGVIYWRDPNLGNLQMSWSWTLFLWSFWQLGVVFTNCGLLAPSLWDPPSTRAPSFSQCAHWDDISCRWTQPHHPAPWISQRSIWYFEGCYGIWGTQWDWAMVERMSFHDAIEVLLQAPNFSSEWSDCPYVH